MYSVLFSKFEIGFDLISERLKELINSNSQVVIIPWSFPIETDASGLDDYFSGKRKDKYLECLKKLGIKDSNITVLNCYRDKVDEMKRIINKSDVLVLPGGNPEMFYNKVIESNLLDTLKNYSKIILGASAGSELQLNNYFITAKNNYYKKFAWYPGFGILDDPFYFDVHSSNNYRYQNKLAKTAREIEKKVYAIYDDGVILYNRKTKETVLYGNVKTYNP